MFMNYVKDRRSWILFFFGALGFINVILWIDQGIVLEITSVLYFNVILLISFMVFFIWRYQVEMKFTKELVSLMEAELDDWHIALPPSNYLSDEVTKELLHQAVRQYTRKLSDIKSTIINDGEYIAAWVHEVKTPLTAMKLIIDEKRGDPAVRKIEAEWLRLHLLVDQQLSIARLPSLEADYVLEKTHLQRLASLEVRELASWCMEKNIAVEFEGESIPVIADEKWCRFIIRQVLTNAVKYSPIGGTILISMKEDVSSHAVLTVIDEGSGMKTHELPRIFDKGFTGETGRVHHAATGLGLYLAQTVATKMGIYLAAYANPRKGITMEMVFPIENEFDQTRT